MYVCWSLRNSLVVLSASKFGAILQLFANVMGTRPLEAKEKALGLLKFLLHFGHPESLISSGSSKAPLLCSLSQTNLGQDILSICKKI